MAKKHDIPMRNLFDIPDASPQSRRRISLAVLRHIETQPYEKHSSWQRMLNPGIVFASFCALIVAIGIAQTQPQNLPLLSLLQNTQQAERLEATLTDNQTLDPLGVAYLALDTTLP